MKCITPFLIIVVSIYTSKSHQMIHLRLGKEVVGLLGPETTIDSVQGILYPVYVSASKACKVHFVIMKLRMDSKRK